MGNDDDNDSSLLRYGVGVILNFMALYNCSIFLFLDTLRIGVVLIDVSGCSY